MAPGKGKTGYSSPTTGIMRNQSQIDEDIKILHGETLSGGYTTNSEGKDKSALETLYNGYSSTDVNHLYTNWKGSDGSGDNAYVEFRIIQVGPHDNDGSAITFMATHSLPTAKQMNSTDTNKNGWIGSQMYQQTMGSYVANNLSQLKPLAVEKKSTTGNSTDGWEATSSTDDFWLLSYSELTGTSQTYFNYEGSQYDWFDGKVTNPTGANTAIAGIDKTRSGSSPAGYIYPSWFERSPRVDATDTRTFNIVYTDSKPGNYGYYREANRYYGVVPAFSL